MNEVEAFCRLVRIRSEENRKAVRLVYRENLTGQMISLLRQELDSMVRMIYLLHLNDLNYRNHLIRQTLSGERWRKLENNAIITDRAMVDISDDLNGWTESVYKFGCAFIHLSNFHDYQENDPFDQLTNQKKEDIKQHLNNYHFFPLSQNLSIQTISPYLPKVFDKISNNLERYIQDIKREKINFED